MKEIPGQQKSYRSFITETFTLKFWPIRRGIDFLQGISACTFNSGGKRRPTPSGKGFSLIELLIVVAIILIIAAIAIPNLLRSRMAANEASAVGSIRTVNTAAITYNATYGNGFPPSLSAIGTTGTGTVSCTNAQLIDSVITAGTKSGYNFSLVHGATALTSAASSCSGGFGYADGYVVTAIPITTGTTGQRAFCSDASGVIRFNAAGTISYTSPNCSSAQSPLQ